MAGECNLNVDNPCSICGGWTSEQWSKLRRSLVDSRTRASQRRRQHWTSAFSQIEAWIISKPAPSATSSRPASEISSVVSGDDFSDRLLVSTSSPLAQQDLVVQVQNGVNMASGTATMAPSTATTAPSTATTAPMALPLMAGPSTPSTIEPIVPIVALLTRPVLLGHLLYLFKRPGRSLALNKRQCSLLPCLIWPCRIRLRPCHIRPCCLRPCRTLPCLLLCQQGLIPIGCLKESSCYNISSFRNCSSLKLGELARPSLSLSPPLVHRGHQSRLRMMLRSFLYGQPALGGLDLETSPRLKPLNVPGLLQHLADPSLQAGTTLEGPAQPQGHLRPDLNGLRTDLLRSF